MREFKRRKDTSPSRTVVAFTVGTTDVTVKLAKRPRDGIRKYFVSWNGHPRNRALGPFPNAKEAVNIFIQKQRNKLVPLAMSQDVEFWVRDQETSDGIATIDFIETFNYTETSAPTLESGIQYFATVNISDRVIIRTMPRKTITEAAFEVMDMLLLHYARIRIL